MLFILEIHNISTHCWSAVTRDEFVATMHERFPGKVTLKSSTPQELLALYGLDSLEEARTEEPWIADLADRHGPYTMLHYVEGEDTFSITPVTPFDAFKTYLADQRTALRVFENTQEAEAALQDTAFWAQYGHEARRALSAELEACNSMIPAA